MPAISRIDWITRQLDMGRMAHVVLGQAKDPNKLKVKVMLSPPMNGTISPCACFGVKSVLGWVRTLVSLSVAMDRGHKHSSGLSEISIWLNLPTTSMSVGNIYWKPLRTFRLHHQIRTAMMSI